MLTIVVRLFLHDRSVTQNNFFSRCLLLLGTFAWKLY